MPETAGSLTVAVGAPTPGRALHVDRAGTLYASRRYRVLSSTDFGGSWMPDGFIPESPLRALASSNRLAARLLRRQIVAFDALPDGARIAVAREGVHLAAAGEERFRLTHRVTRGSRPLNLAVDDRGRILFGEYGELGSEEVRIYVSSDGGRSFEVGFTFPRGEIRHVHNVIADGDRYWVLCGDYGAQAGIAVLSRELGDLEWLRRGEQGARAVSAHVSREALVYGTDSDRERNFIVRVDKRSGQSTRLLEIDGSSLFATAFGPLKLISTCVEPNPACPGRRSALYGSLDGERWQRLLDFEKDAWHPTLFQFGTLVLPSSRSPFVRGVFSGQALRGFDGRLATLELTAPGTAEAMRDVSRPA